MWDRFLDIGAEWTYRWSPSGFDESDPPIWVVDISSLEPVSGVTDADRIREVLETLAAHKPCAIAVDIDFSPGPDGHEIEHMRAILFAQEIARREHVPIFLGVIRALALEPPARWLGDPEYEGMAGAAVTFEDQYSKYPRGLIAMGIPGEKGPSLATRLVNARRACDPPEETAVGEPERVFDWKTVVADSSPKAPDRATKEIDVDAFLVHYGPVDALRRTTIRLDSPDWQENLSRIEKDLVIVGDARPVSPDDQLVVTGHLVPGVYVHACAAYTLAWAPIAELRGTHCLPWIFLAIFLLQALAIVLQWAHPAGRRIHRLCGCFICVTTLSLDRRLGRDDHPLERAEKDVLILWAFQVGFVLSVACALVLFRIAWFDLAFFGIVMLIELILHQLLALVGFDLGKWLTQEHFRT
jgi:CHASE2 domain-containing sensor protein